MRIFSGKKLRYIETIINDDGSIDDKIVLYKPMKGGHTHNHKDNALLRTKFRSKDGRGWAKY